MNKNYNYFEDFGVESRMIEFNVKPEMSFKDLNDSEKEDFFENWSIEDALELCN